MSFEEQMNGAFRRVGKTLGRQLTVTTTVPGTDDLGRPDGTTSSSQSSTYQGRLERTGDDGRTVDAGGMTVEIEAEVWLPDDVTIIPRDSAGDTEQTITDDRTGKVFTPMDYHDEANGWLRVGVVESAE